MRMGGIAVLFVLIQVTGLEARGWNVMKVYGGNLIPYDFDADGSKFYITFRDSGANMQDSLFIYDTITQNGVFVRIPDYEHENPVDIGANIEVKSGRIYLLRSFNDTSVFWEKGESENWTVDTFPYIFSSFVIANVDTVYFTGVSLSYTRLSLVFAKKIADTTLTEVIDTNCCAGSVLSEAIVLDRENVPHIAYYSADGALIHTWQENQDVWSKEVVDTGLAPNWYRLNFVFNTTNMTYSILYVDANVLLKYAEEPYGLTWTIDTVGPGGLSGLHHVAVNDRGNVVVVKNERIFHREEGYWYEDSGVDSIKCVAVRVSSDGENFFILGYNDDGIYILKGLPSGVREDFEGGGHYHKSVIFPVDNGYYIQLPDNLTARDILSVTLYDVIGNKSYNRDIVIDNNHILLRLDDKNKGIYFVKIKFKNGKQMEFTVMKNS